jgi:two-component system phosphate regulon sensor histidine kinase PhoR
MVETAAARDLERFLGRLPHGAVCLTRDVRVVYANRQARRVLSGLRANRPFSDGSAEGRLRAVAERLVTLTEPLAPSQIELADGRTLRVSGAPSRNGDPAVLLFEDVSDEVLHERITSDFVRNAAHQLRTPLAAIASAVQVLQSGAKDDPAARDRFLDHLERHVDRLTRAARGLLLLARFQGGEEPRLHFVEIRPLLEELAADASETARVPVRVECPDRLSALCSSDLLHEALAAVIDNAVAHTVEGSIVLGASEADGRTVIAVTDSGPGIGRDDRSRLFEPFYRSSERGEGFGLGLTIAAQAVAAMGGEIGFENRANGARFTISLRYGRMVE